MISRSSDAPDPSPADDNWHPRATALYESLIHSGQSQFYEASDYEIAATACEVLSGQLYAEKINANAFAAVMSVMSSLLATEGDRRRARLILEHEDVAEAPAVALMAKYRKAANH